jgi:hypothetical protein
VLSQEGLAMSVLGVRAVKRMLWAEVCVLAQWFTLCM